VVFIICVSLDYFFVSRPVRHLLINDAKRRAALHAKILSEALKYHEANTHIEAEAEEEMLKENVCDCKVEIINTYVNDGLFY